MPRNTQEAIPRRPLLQVDSPAPTKLQTFAQPINNYVEPGKDPLFSLADSLSSIQPSLKNYGNMLESQKKAQSEADNETGMAYQLQGKPLPDGASSSMAQGYMYLQRGEEGRKASAELSQQVEDLKDDPQFISQWAHDPQEGIRQLVKSRIAQDTGGIADPTQIKAYAQQVMPLLEQLPQRFSTHQRQRVEEETNQALANRTLDIVNFQGSPEERRQMFNNDWPTWEAVGKTRKDYTNAVVDALIVKATETKSPELLNIADVPDENGVSFTTTPAIKDKVNKAREKITKLEHDEVKSATVQQRQMTKLRYEDLLATDPYSEELEVKNLAKETGEFGALSGENEIGVLWGRVLDARKAADKAKAVEEYIMPHPSQWAANSNSADFKKIYDTENSARYAQIKWDDPNSARAGVAGLLERHRISTLPSKELAGVAGALTTSSVNAVTGEIPGSMMLAIQLYKNIQGSTTPGLSSAYFDGDKGVMAKLISDELGARDINQATVAESIQRVQLSMTDTAKKRRKDIESDPKVKTAVEGMVDSKFTGLFTTDIDDRRGIKIYAQDRVVSLMAALGLDQEKALAVVEVEVSQKYAATGDGGYIEVPKGMAAQDVLQGRKLFLADYSKKHGKGDRELLLNEDGATYTLFDKNLSVPLDRNISVKSLLVLDKPLTFGTPEQHAKVVELASKIKVAAKDGHAGLSSVADVITSNRGLIDTLLEGSTFGWLEKIRLKTYLKTQDVEHRLKSLVTPQKAFMKGVPSVLNGKSPLSTTLPAAFLPGTPKNVYEMALSVYDESPTAAMIMTAEGLMLNPGRDNKGIQIGFGYNLSMHSEKENTINLRKAGIPAEDANHIIAGRIPPGKQTAINTQQALRLFDGTLREHSERAKDVYGAGWSFLPDHAKSVLIDMSYNTGNVAQFRKTIVLFKEGKMEEASKQLTLKYSDRATGKMISNDRRIQIWREMLSGQYKNVIAKHAGKFKQ